MDSKEIHESVYFLTQSDDILLDGLQISCLSSSVIRIFILWIKDTV
ncbi:hypothetical protein IX296_002364 [Bacteroides pyogenes]|nr:hypothetical protein [Bacteroides pyogenes]MBR8739350.1 hypothetical protein [Bacteroides pyogenes]MBR8755209.1 hypothetical protein [Bacteroides pyogenes]MBR8796539.1 hypothetical protein [Bacteroides pyogenes]MBR8810063.1 hypothetical protein [Bacteroides pyogenes]